MLYSFTAGLLPVFRFLWMEPIVGNANFYYAAILLWILSNGLIITDALYANTKYEFITYNEHKDRNFNKSDYNYKQI